MKQVDFAALASYLLALLLAVGTPVLLFATVDDPKQTFPQAGPGEVADLLDAIQSAVAAGVNCPAEQSTGR